jgi:hypothetical protein
MTDQNDPRRRPPKRAGEGGIPDPDPESSVTAGGSGPGGGVEPGETPPEAGQVSAPQGHEEHGPHPAVPWVWIAAIGLVVAVFALAFIGYGVGLWD